MKTISKKYSTLFIFFLVVVSGLPSSFAQEMSKQYELKNHLGNVLTVISNEKDEEGNAVVVSANDYYPFGMIMPGRSYNSAEYRYGFNGQELDNEIKGSGNSLDFGARILDVRLGRFLSIDPKFKTFPSESNYTLSGNNPILNIDIEGEFKIPIHIKILRNAIGKSSINLSIDSKIALVHAESFYADILGSFSDFHFDGRQSFSKVQDTWNQLSKEIANIDFGRYNRAFGGIDAIKLGIALHTVQDFYSHSNYVELYVEYYKGENNGEMPTDVPIFYEGVKIEGFRKLMERTTFDEEDNYQGLHTGEFNLRENEFWDFENNGGNEHIGPNTHNAMNKDKVDTKEGKLAEKVATKHSAKILDNKK